MPGVFDNPVTQEQAELAQEKYQPSSVVDMANMSYHHWTERVTNLSAFVWARELAGLSDVQLSELAAAYAKEPRRKRKDALRFSYPVACVGLAVTAVCTAGHYLMPTEAQGLGGYEVAGTVGLVIAFLGLSLGSLGMLRSVPLSASHAKLGLGVSIIDERHPWLYKAMLLMSNPAAEAYRASTPLVPQPNRCKRLLLKVRNPGQGLGQCWPSSGWRCL